MITISSINDNLFPYNDKLYYGYRKIKSDQIDDEEAKNLKEFWNCDIILKTPQYGGVYLFLREIQDVDFEEITPSDPL